MDSLQNFFNKSVELSLYDKENKTAFDLKSDPIDAGPLDDINIIHQNKKVILVHGDVKFNFIVGHTKK